ncbi:MAG: ABC transporter substrate-binding protein [Proteobacteria bacterium]|nr:ABC transporter substrate-binding protein [Pseudomonadota bacterium]
MKPQTIAVISSLLLAGAAHAQEKFVYQTNWYAQAEHGGFYQALAEGLYKKQGLDVTIKAGGPQLNGLQILAAGQADCMMSTDMAMLIARNTGVPVVTVASVFQKDPQVLIAHEDVKSFAELKGKTIFIGAASHRTFWPWLKAKYGLTDAQVRPYTFNVQPFVGDANSAMQGFLTSEPFALQKAGVKINVLMFSDHGYPAYNTTISCMEKTVTERKAALAGFVRATMEGWKSYLANPAPGNALIRKDNPNMTEEQLAYSVGKLRELGMVTGGDAQKLGIGAITPERLKASYELMVGSGVIDPAKVELAKSYTTEFVRDLKVMP